MTQFGGDPSRFTGTQVLRQTPQPMFSVGKSTAGMMGSDVKHNGQPANPLGIGNYLIQRDDRGLICRCNGLRDDPRMHLSVL